MFDKGFPAENLRAMQAGILCFLLLITAPAVQAELHLEGDLTQGGLLRGQVPPGTRVFYQDQLLRVSPDGAFIVGFGRDAGPDQNLILVDQTGQTVETNLRIDQRTYQIQRIDGISKRMMEPSEQDLVRIGKEAAEVKTVRQIDSELPYFSSEFIWPLEGRISGVYGSQRILNGEPRRPHFGIDIAAATGTAVKAPASGIVTLVHEGMFFSGKTLIIDHGHGLSSSFLHLHAIHVAVGERVRQGDVIAEVGATGRVTGPHLDWRVNWFQERLDPALLVPER